MRNEFAFASTTRPHDGLARPRATSPEPARPTIGIAGLAALAGSAAGLASAAWAVRGGLLGGDVPAGLAFVFLGLQAAALAAVFSWARAHRPSPATTSNDAVPLAAVGDLVTWHDGFGDVVRASPSAAALLGAPPAELIGGGLLSRVHVSDRPGYLRALSEAANGTEPVQAEFRLHLDPPQDDAGRASRSARPIWVELRAHRLRQSGARGEASVVAFIRDASARRDHADELEEARLEAERANELKTRFLATVSHELRTPLNAIIGFSELLSADHPFVMSDERRKEYALIIRDSGHHLLDIVNTLLDMSKIESGNFSFEPDAFDVRALADGVCELMQLKADAAGVTLERRLDAAIGDMVADRRACRQILINLLSNAIKFTPAGGQVIVALTSARDQVTLSISDSGIGIPEADLPRLGDPFFQSGDLHRRNHEGTGLGLSVVRGLVGLHGGRVAVESGSGVGTTVTVTLPARAVPGAQPARPALLQTTARAPSRALERTPA